MAQSTTGAGLLFLLPTTNPLPAHPPTGAHTEPPFYPKQITSHFLSQSASEQPSWTGIKGVFTQPFLTHPPPPNLDADKDRDKFPSSKHEGDSDPGYRKTA